MAKLPRLRGGAVTGPLLQLHPIGCGRAGDIQTEPGIAAYDLVVAISQRLWLPLLVKATAISPKLNLASRRGGDIGDVPDQGGSMTVDHAVIAAVCGLQLPLLVRLLIAAGPLLHDAAVAGSPSRIIDAGAAVLVHDVVPGGGGKPAAATPAAGNSERVIERERSGCGPLRPIVLDRCCGVSGNVWRCGPERWVVEAPAIRGQPVGRLVGPG